MPNSLTAMAQGDGATVPGAAAPEAPAAPQKQIHLHEVQELISKQAEIDRSLRALLKDPGPIKRKAVIDMSVDLVAKRVLSAQEMAGHLLDLPEDPMKIREWALSHAQNVEKGLNQMIDMVHGADAPQEVMQ